MKILFHLGHPAHFHLFKIVISNLKNAGNEIFILIKKKDVLEELLEEEGMDFYNILPEGRKDSIIGMAVGQIKQDVRMWKFVKKHKPDLLVGTSVAISHVGKLLGIPSINVNEDDAHIVPFYSKMAYPFASVILSPDPCNNGKWEHKSVHYAGYHELAYLHPNHFKADRTIADKYVDTHHPYFVIRFAKLGAHHDKGITGINDQIASQIIEILKPHGSILISSERELIPELEQFRMGINPIDMHHIMAFASLYIGDSQTMAAEAGVLGTPFIRFNDFVGKIGYLNELENNYKLGIGIKTNDVGGLLNAVSEIVQNGHQQEKYKYSRLSMLGEKIDVAQFLSWFIVQYPESQRFMKDSPDYYQQFR